GVPPREPRFIMDWAEPGKSAVCFVTGQICLTCVGNYWYESHTEKMPWWTMVRSRPELGMSYYGSTSKLRQHVVGILAGKEVIITTVGHGAHDRGVYFDVAFREV